MAISEKTGSIFQNLTEKLGKNLQKVVIALLDICKGPSVGGGFPSLGRAVTCQLVWLVWA